MGRLGRGEELLAAASVRCWSKGTEGEARTEMVLLRGMGEPGGKTTWGKERRDSDEEEIASSAHRGGGTSPGFPWAFPLCTKSGASLPNLNMVASTTTINVILDLDFMPDLRNHDLNGKIKY